MTFPIVLRNNFSSVIIFFAVIFWLFWKWVKKTRPLLFGGGISSV